MPEDAGATTLDCAGSLDRSKPYVPMIVADDFSCDAGIAVSGSVYPLLLKSAFSGQPRSTLEYWGSSGLVAK